MEAIANPGGGRSEGGSSDKFDGALEVTRLSKNGQVVLNNDALKAGETRKLMQHDKLTLGRAHIFRVYLLSRDPVKEEEHTSTPRHR